MVLIWYVQFTKSKTMMSHSITSWQIHGEIMKTVTSFISWAPKSLEIVTVAVKKRCWSLEDKAMKNLDSILKAETLLYQQRFVYSKLWFCQKLWWMWELDLKKAEHKSIDAFKLRCWTRLLRVPWTARRSNQSTLKEISPEYSLEGPMLKLNLQYFGHLMGRTDLSEKSLMLGKIKGRR